MATRRPFTTILAITWTLAILVACWTPARGIPEPDLASWIPHLDKIIHATMLAGFGFLWMRAGLTDRRRAAWVLGIGLALSALTEAGQALPIVGRDAGVADLAADAVGLCLGVGGAFLLDRLARPEKAIRAKAAT